MATKTKTCKIIYCVDDDTQEAINYWDELDAVRDEQCDRHINVGTFESEEAAKEYLKQAKILYDLVVKFEESSANTAFYDVYNPDACTIHEIDEIPPISLEEAKHYFDEQIANVKKDLEESK